MLQFNMLSETDISHKTSKIKQLKWHKLQQLEQAAVRAALHLRPPILPVVFGFNHNVHSASAYQISAKADNSWLNYWWLNHQFSTFFSGARRNFHWLSELRVARIVPDVGRT